jgi:hypothetical protein
MDLILCSGKLYSYAIIRHSLKNISREATIATQLKASVTAMITNITMIGNAQTPKRDSM